MHMSQAELDQRTILRTRCCCGLRASVLRINASPATTDTHTAKIQCHLSHCGHRNRDDRLILLSCHMHYHTSSSNRYEIPALRAIPEKPAAQPLSVLCEIPKPLMQAQGPSAPQKRG